MKLLQHWGPEGFTNHTKKIQEFYRMKRDQLVSALEKEIPRELAEWHSPSAGMFLWIKIHGVKDTTQLISEKAVNNKVVMVPGRAFTPNGDDSRLVS